MPENDLDLGDDDSSPKDLRTKFTRQYREQGNELSTAQQERDALAREVALLKSGLTLNEVQQKALLASHSGELTADALKATAASLGWAVAPTEQQVQQQQVQNENHAAAQRQAAANGVASTGTPSNESDVITAETVNSWSTDRIMKFQKDHPEATEALLRGESVRASDIL